MGDDRYIWIVRWPDFQHYTPERDRAPAWIKDYTKQLDDDRHRDLTLQQRGLSADLRRAFSKARAELKLDRRKLSQRLGATVYQRDLEALNHAGLIEIISRETLEQRLEQLYSRSSLARARALAEKEVLRTSSKRALESGTNSSRSSAAEKSVCPECEVGSGLHTADCSRAAVTA